MPDYEPKTGEILTPEAPTDDVTQADEVDDNLPIDFTATQEMSRYQLPEASLLAPTPIKIRLMNVKMFNIILKSLKQPLKVLGSKQQLNRLSLDHLFQNMKSNRLPV